VLDQVPANVLEENILNKLDLLSLAECRTQANVEQSVMDRVGLLFVLFQSVSFFGIFLLSLASVMLVK